jgi:hypothetical protein
VEGGRADEENRLFGVLIEQYPEHYPNHGGPRPASAVLFAATISEVFRRFDCFDVGHLISLLPSSSGSTDLTMPVEKRRPLLNDDVEARIGTADAMIQALDGWQKRGLIDEQYVTALKLKVVEQQLLGGGAGEQP